MLHTTPPPVFKYDVADMRDLERRVSLWPYKQKVPETELKEVICGQNTIYRLPDALRSLGVTASHRVLVVMDGTEMKRGGDKLKPLVLELLQNSGLNTVPVVLKGDAHGAVHADFSVIEQVLPHLDANSAVVSVGSGVVTDIAKHSCYLWQKDNGFDGQLPLIACMSACTVPAYSSRSSIISKDGVKRTWPSRLPHIIIMDYRVLCDCPSEYTIAGMGDMFPQYCSYADWFLSDALGLGDFFDGSWRIMDDPKELLVPYSSEVANSSTAGIEVLGKCLTLCGLAMTYARDSVPVSGYEHVMSHMLDMSAAADGRETGLHGQQVGVSIIWSLTQIELLEEYLDKNAAQVDIDACYPDEGALHRHVLDVFSELDPTGAMGAECWRDAERKLAAWKQARPKFEGFLKNWPQYKKALAELLPYTSEQCAAALDRSTHPLFPSELKVPITEKRMRWALRNARFMRKRFTSADMAGFLGLYDDKWEDEVVARATASAKKARCCADKDKKDGIH